MANKIGLEFAGFDEMLKKLAAAEADTKAIAEEALQKSFDIVTAKAEISVQKQNLPAGGKYSSGRTAASLIRKLDVTWSGTEASAPVGFDASHGGLPSIFMIRGSPRYMKNQLMYDAFYGEQTRGEVLNAQKEIFYKALGEAMEA